MVEWHNKHFQNEVIFLSHKTIKAEKKKKSVLKLHYTNWSCVEFFFNNGRGKINLHAQPTYFWMREQSVGHQNAGLTSDCAVAQHLLLSGAHLHARRANSLLCSSHIVPDY